MRIAQLCTRYPPGPGGVERHVEEIATRLAARGDAVTVLTSELYSEFPWRPFPPEVPREVTEGNLTVRRLRVWTLPGELHYPFFRGLDRALVAAAPDVMHAHTYGTDQVAVAGRHHRRHRTPLVLTAHFHPIWSIHGGWFRHKLRGFYDRRRAGPALHEVDRLIVQTLEEERLLKVLGIPLPPITVIPPGFRPLPAPGAGAPSFAERLGLPGPFLLFVGRLASNKGLLELVEAFAPLARSDPSVTLVLVGEDGGMRAPVEARVRALGLSDRVRIPGYLDDATVFSAFKEARLFVLPSEYEAFGLVLLEALAHATPVVASRVGGIPEVLDQGKAGRLVPPKEVAPLAEALQALYDDPAGARALGEYGRSHVVPRYDWDAVTAALRTVYEEVQRR